MFFTAHFQNAYVTHDYEKAKELLSKRFGLKDWLDIDADMELKTPEGVKASTCKVGLAWQGGHQIELIQPLTGYSDHYDAFLPDDTSDPTPRFHHVCVRRDDLDAMRKEIEEKLEREVSEFEFASYLMYPKVFTEFATVAETYGPVSALPTPIYFYGLKPEDEVFVEIERGKTLVIRNLAVGEPDEKGMVTVFFELNGQPRRIKVPDRAHGATGGAVRRKAEAGNEAHVGAPMPGVVSTVSVAAGDKVSAGDVLLSIEAMKMETAIHAERDGTIAEVAVKPGDQLDAKDLLIAYE